MQVNGPWSKEKVWSFAKDAVIPARIACHSSSDWPATVSLWFLVEDEAFWCATPETAFVAKWLRRDPRCAIEIAPEHPPYLGLRAQCRATLEPDPERRVLRKVINRYLGSEESGLAKWLLRRPVNEQSIRLDPLRLTSWDFSVRMSDAFPSQPTPFMEASHV
jgi:hypothetical protein